MDMDMDSHLEDTQFLDQLGPQDQQALLVEQENQVHVVLKENQVQLGNQEKKGNVVKEGSED